MLFLVGIDWVVSNKSAFKDNYSKISSLAASILSQLKRINKFYFKEKNFTSYYLLIRDVINVFTNYWNIHHYKSNDYMNNDVLLSTVFFYLK